MNVFDQVGVHALAVAHGSLEADRILDQIEQLADTLLRKAALLRELLLRRLAVVLLSELAARAHEPSDLVRDVDRQADRPALVGERARNCLADPPGRVRRKLVAELVVELLHCTDQPEVPLLDQVEKRNAGLRVVAGDRHDEAEVRLDQLLLGLFVAFVLPPGELALLGGRQERAVADRADVELERILGRLGPGGWRDVLVAVLWLLDLAGGVLRFLDLGLLRLFDVGYELEPRFDGGVRGQVRKRPHARGIGAA